MQSSAVVTRRSHNGVVLGYLALHSFGAAVAALVSICEREHGVLKRSIISNVHAGICRVCRGAYDANAQNRHGVRLAA